jgi:hypothetical protein
LNGLFHGDIFTRPTTSGVEDAKNITGLRKFDGPMRLREYAREEDGLLA